MQDLRDYRATFLSFALPPYQQYGRYHTAAPPDNVPIWDETTDPEEYKKQIDEYGNGYTQADYYTSPAYLAYLKQVLKLSAAKAAEEAARMTYMVNKAMADASAAAAAASEAEKQRLIDEAIAKAIKEAEDAAKNYTIMGVKVPKVAVWLIGGGAAFFLIWKFVIKK